VVTETRIPRWLTALDDRKPYIEVLTDEWLPDVTSYDVVRGVLKGRISSYLAEWARGRGVAGLRIRYYFQHPNQTWSSLVPVASFMSFARFPELAAGVTSFRPRIAPEIAVDVLSPNDLSSRTLRKVQTYLEFRAALVMIFDPVKRRVSMYRPDGTVEERDAQGSWTAEPFDDLILSWEKIYCNLEGSR
jgi:Uma2 family endonuclease